MNKLLLASLLALTGCSPAAADTKAPAPTPAPKTVIVGPGGCLVTQIATTVIFEIHQKPDKPKLIETSTLKVMSNGAWTYVESLDGKQTANRAGCMDSGQLQTIKALGSASWKTTLADAICDGFATSSTEYHVNGKHVLTRRVCDRQILAPATAKSLADATRIASQLTRPKP